MKSLSSAKPSLMPQNWIDYWDQDPLWSNSVFWKINAQLLFEKTPALTSLNSSSSVATLGCGPGFFEALLAPRVKSLVALDTSARFVEECKKNCAAHSNVQVLKLGEDYTDLSLIPEKFSLLVCASVVQYYKDLDEIVALIQSASSQALPGAALLITDIPMKRSFFQKLGDVFTSLFFAAKQGHLFPLIGATFRSFPEIIRYQRISHKIKNHEFTFQELREIIQKSELPGRILSEPLSIHAKRPGLLIQLQGDSSS